MEYGKQIKQLPVERLSIVYRHQNLNLIGQPHVELLLPNNFAIHDALRRQ